MLARLMDREANRNAIRAVKMASGTPAITKLFYADDVMLFCNAKVS